MDTINSHFLIREYAEFAFPGGIDRYDVKKAAQYGGFLFWIHYMVVGLAKG